MRARPASDAADQAPARTARAGPVAPATAPASPATGVVAEATLAALLRTTGRHAVIVGVSKDPNAKLVALLLADGRRSPTLVAKVATTPGADRAVSAEAHLLAELHRRHGGHVMATVPRPLDVVDAAGRTAVVFSALPGAPLLTAYHRRRHTSSAAGVHADLEAVRRWSAAFEAATATPGDGGTDAGPPVAVDEPDGEAELLVRFGHDPRLPAVLRGLAEARDRLGSPRRVTAVHGDLWAGNVLLTAGAVTGVVDWEAGAPTGDPRRDAVRFALAYALYLGHRTGSGRAVAGHPGLRADRWGAGIRYAMRRELDVPWFPALFRGFLGDALQRNGTPAERWRDAAVVGVAEVAAGADHPAFAGRHFDLLADLLDVTPPAGGAPQAAAPDGARTAGGPLVPGGRLLAGAGRAARRWRR
jgi:hypothetical protein